jgi:hypothetical protein
MTTSTPAAHERHTATGEAAPTTAAAATSGLTDSKRPFMSREAVLATALVALVAAVVLFGIVFPALLAPAVAIAVLAAIVALEAVLPCGQLRRTTRSTR